ncbi:MAG: CTP synthase [Bacillota bacterium]|nr:CTP synthase [Bacillota bacterium]
MQQILTVCGGVSVVGAAVAVVWKFIRPATQVAKRVTELERRSEKDYQTLQRLESMSRDQSRAMLQLLNHMIDGNNVTAMKKTRDKLQESLVNQ